MVLPTTIEEALAEGRQQADGERLTISTMQALLAHVTGRGRAWLLTHREEDLRDIDAARYLDLLARAAAGEPLAQLTGEREFYGLAFTVTPDVLIPRPETEAVVDTVLEWLDKRTIAHPHLVDVGTGSGAIAVTLALKVPKARVTAVEISPAAMDIARRNAERHGVADRMNFVIGDLLTGLAGPFDVVAANLPYINCEELTALEVGRWEPRVALDGGEDGLALVRRLLEQAPPWLADDGLLVLEIGHDQGQRVEALCRAAFPAAQVQIHPDLAKLDRIVTVETRGSK
jgi:release factor glutamine methyltransferase